MKGTRRSPWKDKGRGGMGKDNDNETTTMNPGEVNERAGDIESDDDSADPTYKPRRDEDESSDSSDFDDEDNQQNHHQIHHRRHRCRQFHRNRHRHHHHHHHHHPPPPFLHGNNDSDRIPISLASARENSPSSSRSTSLRLVTSDDGGVMGGRGGDDDGDDRRPPTMPSSPFSMEGVNPPPSFGYDNNDDDDDGDVAMDVISQAAISGGGVGCGDGGDGSGRDVVPAETISGSGGTEIDVDVGPMSSSYEYYDIEANDEGMDGGGEDDDDDDDYHDDDDHGGGGDISTTTFDLSGACRSVEEASVDTTIEMLNAAEGTTGMDHEDDVYDREGDRDKDSRAISILDVVDAAAAAAAGDVAIDLTAMTSSPVAGGVGKTSSSSTAFPPDAADVVIASSPPSSSRPSSPSSPSIRHNVTLRLTSEEERIFKLLVDAAEAYEVGLLESFDRDSMMGEDDLKFGGGFGGGGGIEQRGGDISAFGLQPPPPMGRGEKGDDETVERRPMVGIRVAGGWVRDKLLNQHSADVDVALDCMMGVQFARIVQCYMASSLSSSWSSSTDEESDEEHRGMDENGDDDDDDGGGGEGRRRRRRRRTKRQHPKIGVIGANPSQSKHLETATMKIHGIDVDFVNLRANEVYGADSRIPTFDTPGGSSGPAFGAPLEDALRRDFTINSLFYNVRTGKIEDWTGRGLDDLLHRRLVVTPVDPHVTFHDDPLRVLRAIRFAVRLDFALDGSIVEAAMSKRVHRSLHAKVSRERVGKELEGMLSGKHARPGKALDAIGRLHLAGSVFAFPGTFPGDLERVGGPVRGRILGVEYACVMGDAPDEDIDDRGCIVGAAAVELAAQHRARGWEESRLLLAILPMLINSQADERNKTTKATDVASLTSVDPRLLYLSVFIMPFRDLIFLDKKGREMFVTSHMVKESIKFSLRDTQAVSKILTHIDAMVTILSEIRSQLASDARSTKEGGEGPYRELTVPCRLRVGLLLRSLKEYWVTCLIAAAAWETRTHLRSHDAGNDLGGAISSVPEDMPSRELYRAIVDELDLDGCWRVRPHLNGKDIIKELDLRNNGPLVGLYVEDQTRWMLLNPHGTKEDCVTYLRGLKSEREGVCAVGSVNNDISSPILKSDNGAKHSPKKSRVEN
ncbi:hypothetical protein ACHAXA_008284 [Cyclostephanos tholiformis]|uniref:Poly A polymerase head domain-containing protein n=1 Tax=Cyclostephanos tholiformis TaxID=382380 RepID=A0ABD3RDM2_9STRA